ncbi:MAG TPA: oligosaccharide flippase family protein [Anaerolineae bacterium]|nr:oligosaccharide flippase family protein [Anaerolineae bacterium]
MKKVGRNTIIKLVADIIGSLASFALVLIAVRTLTTDDFGLYNYGLTLGFVFAQITDLGFKILLTREIATNPNQPYLVRQALHAKLFLTLPALLLIIYFILPYNWPQRFALLALSLIMIGLNYLELAFYIFRGQQNLLPEAILLLALKLLTTTIGTLTLLFTPQLLPLALSTLLVMLIINLIAYRHLANHGWLAPLPPNHPFWPTSHQWRQAIPLGLAIFLSIAYTRVAIFLLEAYQDNSAIAHYSAAYRLIEPLQLLPAALLAAIFPAYSHALHHQPRYANQLAWGTTSLLLLASATIAATLILTAPWLIPQLYGSDYAPSIPVLRYLAAALIPIYINYGLTHFLIARHQQHITSLLVTIMLLGHLYISTQLIPTWGAAGPAISVIIAEIILLFGCGLTLIFSSPPLAPVTINQ